MRTISQGNTHTDSTIGGGKERPSSDVSVQQVMRIISKALLYLILYPFLHIISHIRLLIDNDVKHKELGEELSLIFITIEAPLQVSFTLWLILRGIVVSPLDYSGNTRVISWWSDRFGNPIPVPTFPLASIVTSMLSILGRLALIHLGFAFIYVYFECNVPI